MIVSAKLDIPKEYVKDVTSGAIDISKAVLRDVDSGKIVKHAKLFVDNGDTAEEVVESVGMKNLGIAGLVVGSVALVGFGVYKVVKNFNKDKEINMPKSITEFHNKLNKYLEEANKGILNVNSIDDVLKAIDEIERLKDQSIKIDFSTKEVRNLLNSIYKFTAKLNKNDKHNKIKFKAPSKNSKDNVVCLKDYLKYQKELAIAG